MGQTGRRTCARCGRPVRLVTKTYFAEPEPKMIKSGGQEFQHWEPHLPNCPMSNLGSEKPEPTANIMGRTLKKGESIRMPLRAAKPEEKKDEQTG